MFIATEGGKWERKEGEREGAFHFKFPTGDLKNDERN